MLIIIMLKFKQWVIIFSVFEGLILGFVGFKLTNNKYYNMMLIINSVAEVISNIVVAYSFTWFYVFMIICNIIGKERLKKMSIIFLEKVTKQKI